MNTLTDVSFSSHRKSVWHHAFSFLAMNAVTRYLRHRTSVTTVCGFKIVVLPGVFHPRFFFSSKILGSYISHFDLTATRVLDMGTGTGLIALCAARSGAKVIAVDINPVAVECAQQNASDNQLRHSVEVIPSNLFDAISPSERFDYIFWNPPYYPRSPSNVDQMAWNAGDEYQVIQEFAREVAQFMNESARVTIILSSEIDVAKIISFFTSYHFRYRIAASTKRLFETFLIIEFLKPLR